MNKPYLIMLPGWGMKSTAFKKINEFLSMNFQLISIEWDRLRSIDEFKQRVIGVIKEKKLNCFSLLGWSLGALVAEEIVLEACFNINSIILIGGTSCFIKHKEDNYNIGWNKRILERMKIQLKRNFKKTLIKFNSSMFSKAEKQEGCFDESLYIAENSIEGKSVNSLILGLNYLIEKDFRNKLEHIQIPLLIIHGEEDNICPLEGALYIKSRVSHCHIKIIKQAGHIPFLTNTNACYKAICEFIEEENI